MDGEDFLIVSFTLDGKVFIPGRDDEDILKSPPMQPQPPGENNDNMER